MPINLTTVFGSLVDLKKSLFFDTDNPDFNQIVFKNLDSVLLVLDSGFYLSKNVTGFYVSKSAIAKIPGAEENRSLTVVDLPDDVDFEEIITLTTSVSYGNNENYKIKSYIRPRAVTRKYKILLQATGEVS